MKFLENGSRPQPPTSRGGWRSTDVFSLACLVVSGIYGFYTRNHVYAYTCRNTGHPYTYIHIHIYTHTYTYTYTCILPRTYTHVYIHTYIHIHIYPCIYTYIHSHAHTHAYTCICISTNCRGIRTSVLTYYIHIPTPPPAPPTPTPHPFHAFSLCGIHVPRSAAKTCERRGREGGGIHVYFYFWFGFFLCPISPKKDTTHQVKPIVEAQEYVYFLYICIHTLTPRSQLPPLLSWFDYLNMIMYSPHMSHVVL